MVVHGAPLSKVDLERLELPVAHRNTASMKEFPLELGLELIDHHPPSLFENDEEHHWCLGMAYDFSFYLQLVA